MQTLKHPHPTQPGGRCPPRKSPRRVLLPYAALVVIGAALGGCGVEPIDLGDSTNPVKTLDSLKCTSETQGGATSCKDEKTWSAYGAMACAGKGLVLNHISFATSCGAGLYREATYDCCTASPPSPPPPVPPRMCMWSPAIGPAACQPADAWKKQGITFCSTHGLQLNDLKLDRPCGAGGYGSAQFECCTTTPPPPPPPMCTTEVLAEKSCVDDGTWKAKADAACKAKKLNLTTLAFGAACMGGHLDVKFECCPVVTPPPPPMCTTEVLVEKSCVDDGRWKAQAEAACKAKMQSLGTLAFGTACMGGHLDVKFECCGPTTPPPPPPPGMCTTEALTERSCIDDATWKTRADAACKAKKLNLTALAFGAACMGGHMDVKFECCPVVTPPPPPPPPACTTDVLADKSCVDDGTWKTRADAACRAKMQTLSSLSFGAACMGGHLEVKFECCGPMPPPPPPPPPPMCTKETLAAMACIDDASWKTRAAATCAAKKLTLNAIAYGTACMGGHQDITFECCPVVTPPPPPPMCTTDKAPSSGKCQTPAQWKTDGDNFCAAKKQTLTSLSMSVPCMGGFSEAEFECCGATPPPPPPTCTSGVVGDGRTCNTESALKSQAEGVCKMAGLRLTAFSPYDACGAMAQYLHAKYECCK